jgi:hypothetical protein
MEDQVLAAQRGDPVAMSLLLEDLAGRLGRVCGAIALDRGDDALQETLIIVMRNLPTLREPRALYGFVALLDDGWSAMLVEREEVVEFPRAWSGCRRSQGSGFHLK